MPSLPYIQKLTCQCSKVGSKVVQDCVTNLSGSSLAGVPVSIDIGWWRMARNCLLALLHANHISQTGWCIFRGVFCNRLPASLCRWKQEVVQISCAYCRVFVSILVDWRFFFCLFMKSLQKLPFSKSYCEEWRDSFNSRSSCGITCGCGLFLVWGMGFFESCSLWFYLFEWQVAYRICVLSVLFCSCFPRTHFLWPEQSEQCSFVSHWSCPKRFSFKEQMCKS